MRRFLAAIFWFFSFFLGCVQRAAVKLMNLLIVDRKEVQHEIKMVNKLDHPNVITIINSKMTRDYAAVAMTLCEGSAWNLIQADGGFGDRRLLTLP